MEIKSISVGSFEVNCSVVAADGKAWVIDPGSEAERIVALVESMGCEAAGILLTHAHFDHIGAIPGLQHRWPSLPVYVHERDVPIITHALNQFPPDYPQIPMPAHIISSDWPKLFTVIETPGHTPGGVCFLLVDRATLFSGDTLFAGSVGRTDLPGGNMSILMESLKRLTALPENIRVIPGHGPSTTIGQEKAMNPFLQ